MTVGNNVSVNAFIKSAYESPRRVPGVGLVLKNWWGLGVVYGGGCGGSIQNWQVATLPAGEGNRSISFQVSCPCYSPLGPWEVLWHLFYQNQDPSVPNESSPEPLPAAHFLRGSYDVQQL